MDPAPKVLEAGPLVARGSRALHERGDLATARRLFRSACEAANRAGDRAALAEAAIGLGGIWVHEDRRAGSRAEVVSWQRRALALADGGSHHALQLRARLAADADYRVAGHDAVSAVLAEAQQRDDPRTTALVLSLTHHCILGPEHGARRAALAEEMLLAAARSGRRSDRLMGVLWRAVDQFLAGDSQAQRSLAEVRDELASGDHLAVSFVVRAIEVMLAIRSGHLMEAESLAVACRHLGATCGDLDSEAWLRGQMLAIRWFQGRVGELLPELAAQVHSPALGTIDESHVAALAVAAARTGDHRAAAGALARLGGGDLSRVPSSSSWLVTMYGAVEAAALLADAGTAEVAYRLLTPFADLPMQVSLAVSCFGSVEQALGVAALTMGRSDRAVDHLNAAVRRNLALAHWPAACLSRHRLAEALGRRAGPGDAAAAARELAHAQRESEELGTVPPSPLPIAAAARRELRTVERGDVAPAARHSVAVPGSAAVRVQLLGPVEVTGGATQPPLSGARRKAVLAVLALHAGHVVSTGRLIDVVWGEHAPRTAVNALQYHVSYLRRHIGVPDAILTQHPGYLLNLGDGGVDAGAAERLIRRATLMVNPVERASGLQAALALWQGQPLSDILDSSWMEAQAERLVQLRVDAQVTLAEAWLAVGRHHDALMELGGLAHEHPLHEPVHALLIVALYRAGRQRQALAAYQRLHRGLDELGLEPSSALRDLQTAVLRQDAALDLGSRA